ncbi:MAG: class I SAM-dependent methyltransferase [Patescibacteria group bacterium]|nr:class I SAM-dependent methyltransferase [Patescibacteria group bacterium]
MEFTKQKKTTSWESSGNWYNQLVGTSGHYYHQHVILPRVIKLLSLSLTDKLLDVGCGQGILARSLPPLVEYLGVDLAKNLISFAREHDKNPRHTYRSADATKSLQLENKTFTHAAAILSLQNMENQEAAIRNTASLLEKNGMFIIVLNHPCFRIPRQSGWGISESKQQYRYINRYYSPMKIPITMHPGEKQSALTWSFHYPLSSYFHFLDAAGLVVKTMEEWISDKESVGKASKMENRARSEIPLFLVVVAIKQ